MLPGLCALPPSLGGREAAFSVGQAENLRGERGLQFALVSLTLFGTTNQRFYVLTEGSSVNKNISLSEFLFKLATKPFSLSLSLSLSLCRDHQG